MLLSSENKIQYFINLWDQICTAFFYLHTSMIFRAKKNEAEIMPSRGRYIHNLCRKINIV